MNKDKILKKSNQFTQIIKQNICIKNYNFSIYIQKSNDTLYGITVPKKIGKAHIRNKIKRQIKNIITNNEKDITKNINYVIIIRKDITKLDYLKVESELISLMKKVSKK